MNDIQTVEFNNNEVKLGAPETFGIDETNVDGELCGAGRELQFYASLSADLRAQVENAKLELEAYDAELSLQTRLKTVDTRVTDSYLKDTIRSDKTHQKLEQEVIKKERDYNKVENLFRTHMKRTDCIIALAYKQRTEISKNY